MLDADSYPWEQIAPSSIDPHLIEDSTAETGCDGHIRCTQSATSSSPSTPVRASRRRSRRRRRPSTMPDGHGPDVPVRGRLGSGRAARRERTVCTGRSRCRRRRCPLPLPETAGGTVYSIETYYTATTLPTEAHATGQLTSGDRTATTHLSSIEVPIPLVRRPRAQLRRRGVAERPRRPRLSDGMIYYEWISPSTVGSTTRQQVGRARAQDEDYYLVDATRPASASSSRRTRPTARSRCRSTRRARRLRRSASRTPAPRPGPRSPSRAAATAEPGGVGRRRRRAASPGRRSSTRRSCAATGRAEVEAASTDAAARRAAPGARDERQRPAELVAVLAARAATSTSRPSSALPAVGCRPRPRDPGRSARATR